MKLIDFWRNNKKKDERKLKLIQLHLKCIELCPIVPKPKECEKAKLVYKAQAKALSERVYL